MSERHRLFGAGRRVRFALCLSLILLTTLGGSLTVWSVRARSQAPEETTVPAASSNSIPAKPILAPTPGDETEAAPATEVPAANVVPAASQASTAPSPSAQANQTSTRIEAERLVIRRYGFEPAQITRPQGKVLFALDNFSGVEELELQLATESGSRIRRVRLSGDRRRWREVVKLPPGTYLLTEANHSQWQCRITITAQ